MKNQNGFTLVELLAVIVILAIILVIAVPQIMSTIESARKASMEASVKMIAAAAEREYSVAQTLGQDFAIAANTTCGDWSGITAGATSDYATCKYGISNGVATVTLTGTADKKFDGYTCVGTRSTITSCVKS